MLRIVADQGNTRLKWGRVDDAGRLGETLSLPADPTEWGAAWERWNPSHEPSRWLISTVHPEASERLRAFLESRQVLDLHWCRSAADVPVKHRLEHPERTGADRALAVMAAGPRVPVGTPALLVMCGTAITVERVGSDGVWEGGAIAPGLRLSATALNRSTAQLPMIDLPPHPPAWGASTVPAMAAGIFWGAVGTIRELIQHQFEPPEDPPFLIWTGGDAPILKREIAWPGAILVPNLVLEGLAHLIHGIDNT